MQKGGENSETNQEIFQPKRLAAAVFVCGMLGYVCDSAGGIWDI